MFFFLSNVARYSLAIPSGVQMCRRRLGLGAAMSVHGQQRRMEEVLTRGGATMDDGDDLAGVFVHLIVMKPV